MKLLSLVMLISACDSGAGPIDITVAAGGSLNDAEVASIRSLYLQVAGTETAQADYSLTNPFADHRQERVVYNTHAESGLLHIEVDAFDVTREIAWGDVLVVPDKGAAIPVTIWIDK